MTPQEALEGWLPGIPTNLTITPISTNQHTLTSTTSLPRGTPLLTVPDTHTITTTSALLNPAIQTILCEHPAPAPTTSSQAALLLHVLLCKQDQNYAPYFDNLPERIVTATTSRSVRGLVGTPLYHLSLALRHELDVLYERWFAGVKACTQEFAHVDRDEFLYAHAVLESRAVGLGRIACGIGGKNGVVGEEDCVILPFLDFCNHSNTPNCVLTNSGLTLTADRDIAQGEQLTICYGRLSNMLLLLHWGFALPDNPFDEVVLRLEEPDDVARYIVLSVLVGEPEFVLTVDDPLPAVLVRAIRILVVGDVTNGVKRNFDVPLRKEETRVVEVLRELVAGLRCADREADTGDDVKEEGNTDGKGEGLEDEEFERYCGIYRDGIDRILDAAEVRIAAIEAAIEVAIDG